MQEVDEAEALMKAIGGTDMSTYRDRYREAVEEVVAAKAEGRVPPAAETDVQPAGAVSSAAMDLSIIDRAL
ncbi:hypothetical protein LRS74_00605 [Streptomyces sp. LX-29]|uniref:hypothetical protein n=1 Tax=Streptomyces sp. LX-29 TaxID=2900152 RepID=UPI00240D03C3|nr:hypothetical protein [Streptomyces sp. LX-29]WFB05679.1 hypothetical protein LRS74_00605 [Streptomyces sp. LX-29]